ncbi:AarF/ABC1/UbiB kinase family protein [Paraglaciecola sp.]|uniref:ABC1 kinase family protein n=1 Tax=Paraglaciecola sp. TaxID=1920173 RepID=UPI00273F28AB|nr:AarF/ABC1/UbiB kinase family protein [Paraglaciecola sp.]MDP5030876.1 AarF/ABC1/UbiB kinase family protein [Paraglaciecola sp.]
MSTKDNKPALALPSSRLSRFTKLGSLATRVAGNMLADGVSEFARGNRPKFKDLLLTPGNVTRVADQLAQMRGAAMKVGQLLSMDAGDLLPPELSTLLVKLRSDAHAMPEKELVKLLTQQWGVDWRKRFIQFPLKPIAAASIGQVHKVIDDDLNLLAIKIQYPGIKQSIDSDVDNVATLINMTGLLPKKLNLTPLLIEAKKQLHDEANYVLEGQRLAQYAQIVADDDAFLMPRLAPALSSDVVLAMTYIEGKPIEDLQTAPQVLKDKVITDLMRLLFKELFEFNLVQTDPNFANYLFNHDEQKIVLLDFGATREFSAGFAQAYRRLMQAAIAKDKPTIQQAAIEIGLMGSHVPDHIKQIITDIAYIACEPLYAQQPYDFANSGLSARLQKQGMQIGLDKDYIHTPPSDAIFLHRKLGGLFLLAIKLKAKVDMAALFKPYQ